MTLKSRPSRFGQSKSVHRPYLFLSIFHNPQSKNTFTRILDHSNFPTLVDLSFFHNMNGAQVLWRQIKEDHCRDYNKHEQEDEETRRQNREARGVCRAFQRGECTRGDSCKFSHDEKRAANTGWGHEEDRSSKRDHDKFNGAKKGGGTRFGHRGDFKPYAEEKTY